MRFRGQIASENAHAERGRFVTMTTIQTRSEALKKSVDFGLVASQFRYSLSRKPPTRLRAFSLILVLVLSIAIKIGQRHCGRRVRRGSGIYMLADRFLFSFRFYRVIYIADLSVLRNNCSALFREKRQAISQASGLISGMYHVPFFNGSLAVDTLRPCTTFLSKVIMCPAAFVVLK